MLNMKKRQEGINYKKVFERFDVQSILTTLISHHWHEMVDIIHGETKLAFAVKYPVDNDPRTKDAWNHTAHYIGSLVPLEHLLLRPETLPAFLASKEVKSNLLTFKPVIEELVKQERLDASVLSYFE